MKIVRTMTRYIKDNNGAFKEVPLSVWSVLDWKMYKRYSFWLYGQHSNGMFYLKKIWKLKTYIEQEWLFWKLGHYDIEFDSLYKGKLLNFYVCMFEIPYSAKLRDVLPTEINPLHLTKRKRQRKKIEKEIIKQKSLFY